MSLGDRALRWAYRRLAYPSLRFAFAAIALRNRKVRKGLAMRAPDESGARPWQKAPKGLEPIWFHCASGEFEYAKPVIRALKERWPRQTVAVTFFSPTAEAPVRSFPGVDFSCPSPWDEPRSLSEFLERARPKALLIARTDAWPEMAEQARLAQVPSLLFSATLPATSFRSSAWARPLARLSFGPLSAVHCVSEEDRAAFERLGVGSKASVAGDARFDQALHRVENPRPFKSHLFDFPPGREPSGTIVAGSTWPDDEAPLIEAFRTLKARARLCVTPHEPDEAHVAALEARLAAAGFRSARYSRSEEWPEGSVLIVDQVGTLAELYSRADAAFVGGSFGRSVHSVMEPLAAGARAVFGPRHLNNREAIEFQRVKAGGLPAAIAAADANVLADALRKSLEAASPESRRETQEAVRARAGSAVKKALEWIEANGRLKRSPSGC